MAKTIRILGVHGLGDQRLKDWEGDWARAVESVFPDPSILKFDFVNYDDIFAEQDIGVGDTLEAAAKLLGSKFGSILRPRRGFLDQASHRLRWTAGYVVAWTASKPFQQKSRKRVLDTIRTVKPDVVLAHSLGSLVT